MSCCREKTIAGMTREMRRRGLKKEAAALTTILAGPAGLPKPCQKYFKACEDRGGKKGLPSSEVPGYCARVAWTICCEHKVPDYPGCSK